MVSAGSYILGVALLAVLVASLAFSAVRIRRTLLPAWTGAPAHLVDAVLGVALLIWLCELLGIFGLLYAGALVGASLVVAAATALLPRVAGRGGTPIAEDAAASEHMGVPAATGPAGRGLTVVAVAVVAVVFAHWGLTTADALSRGIFNFDSLWYHLPFAVEMAHSHSVTGLHYTETVFTNWFYPQNSELLHSVGVLLTGRDTLSLFLNFGWLAVAFLAAWCIGRPYGKAPLTTIAAGVLLECHTLVVREPGAAKNDLMAAALLLAAIAILINARAVNRERGGPLPGWPLAAAGLATGMAVGTKSTAVAMAAALTVAIVFLAPAGRRWAATSWWFAAALAGGGYWYLRNLIVAGNPLPQLENLGPIPLSHPERLQEGRPDFSIAHYATDTGVWTGYFTPELHQAFGVLWPIVLAAAIAGGLTALLRGRTPVIRWIGGVALFGMLAYLFTPLSAAGAEGAPEGFGINIRYAIPALLAGIALLPLALARIRDRSTAVWVFLGVFLVLLVVTDRSDATLRDPDRIFAWGLAILLVLIPAALLFVRRRGLSRAMTIAGFAALASIVAAIGYPVQRDYLGDRYANADPETSIPGMDLDSAYRWARDVHDSRIGLAGTTAGFLEYGFYGTDLSNRVRYLGVKGPHGAFNAIQTCAGFRAAVNDADLDYLVTAPFLNFIESDEPIRSPEAGWLRGERAVEPILNSGPVTVWRVRGRLDPRGCGPLNEPRRTVPHQPGTPDPIEAAGTILSSRNAIAILGDSYSAGEGADVYLPGTDTRANPCHRSPFTYLVQAFDIPPARNLACSGAVAADVLSPQPQRTVDAQADQLRQIRDREGVDAVVLTLGGNDIGFADIGASCLIPRAAGCWRIVHTGLGRGPGTPSEDFVDERIDALPALLRPAYLAIDHALNEAAASGDEQAPILVLAYPLPVPAKPRLCPETGLLLSRPEIGFLDDLLRRLDDTIAATVADVRRQSGAPIFYVADTERAFLPDHTLCDAGSFVRRPASFNGAGREGRLGQGARELLHPTLAGYAAISRAILRWSRGEAADEALAFLEGAPPAEHPPALTSPR